MASLRRVGTWSGDSKNKMLFQDKVLQTHWLNTSVHPLWHYCKRRSPDVQRYTHRENLRSSQLGAKTDTADSELKNTEKFENMDSTALVTLLLINLGTGDTIYQAPKPSDIKSQPRDNAEADLTKTYAQTYLWKYGWIEPVRWDSLPFRGVASRSKENPVNADISSLLSEGEPLSSIQDIPKHPDPTLNPRFIAALKRFQEANRLRVTGMLDDATRDAMNAPRCGVPDRKIPEVEKSEEVNPTESGISTSDPQHSDPAQITTTVPSITSASQRIRRELMEKKKSSQPQVGSNLGLGRHVRKKRGEPLKAGNKKGIFSKMTIKWRLLGEGYSVWLNIDQQRSILMRAFRIWSEVVPLNFEEDVTSPAHLIDIKLGFGTGRHLGCSQLFDGMGREFAHAWRLGDIHFDDDEHFVPPNSEQGISLLKVAVHEIGHVLGLSHMNEMTSVMQPNYIPANSRMELDRTDRKAIQRIYGRCSGRFSTVFDWVHRDHSASGNWVFQTYFFRKSWYWMYENRSNRTRYRDPRVLANGWRGIPTSDIDAFVHIWTREEDLTLFFKGSQYWRYDNENDRAYLQDSEGHIYPRLISEGFPGISGPIDTAFYDRKERNVFFFRGQNGINVWRMVGDRGRQDNLPHNSLLPRIPINEQWLDICDVHPSMLTAPRR
ncbi:matrix metalloproteinase-21-like isoform X2 [Engystomops pustulosus]|uniref:matrix metalloproteinase-21-like isoform X2 n=1 Tax=Engystomops pustulosus TaxID=76066 RepID=UPI003AFB09A2